MRMRYRKEYINVSFKIAIVLAISLLLAACAPETPVPSTVSPLASPLEAGGSPLATPTREVEPFQMDKPLVAGMSKITGSGPAGIPVLVADVTMGGQVLGRSTINNQGEFEIKLNAPLEARHRLGLTLGDMTGTGKQYEDFYFEGYYGDEALTVPQVGFFFDTAMVKEKE